MMDRKDDGLLEYGWYLTDSWQTHMDGKPYCEVCSETTSEIYPDGITVYHNHESSKEIRIRAALTDMGEYMCATCRVSPHTYKGGKRVALLITSSTLANWQNQVFTPEGMYRRNDYPGDELHCDYIAVRGATIQELAHAFICEYAQYWRPIDVVLVGGVNNWLQGQEREQVMSELKTFKDIVIRTGKEMGHENTFAVCTNILPPAVSRLAYDRQCRLEDWRNRTVDIMFVNDFIRDLNREGEYACYTRHAPQMHCYGLRRVPENHLLQNYDTYVGSLNQHRLAAWREWDMDRMVHLSDLFRLRAGKAVMRYLSRLYHITDDVDMNREEERLAKEQEEIDRELERERVEMEEQLFREEMEAAERWEAERQADLKRRREEMSRKEREMLAELEKFMKEREATKEDPKHDESGDVEEEEGERKE